MTIQHAYTLNPVTALAHYYLGKGAERKELLLAGEGAFLKVYDVKHSKLIAKCRIFSSQTVHGIAVQDGLESGNGLLAIWGGRSFTLLDLVDLKDIISGDVSSFVSNENVAPDWLLACAISPFDSLGGCIFITAHSAALQVLPVKDANQLSVRRLSSPSRSILYSAHVIWTSKSSIMVAAGTVFGEIEIFTGDIHGSRSAETSEILFTFTGHEGSIFGVQISPEIRGPNGELTRVLASCSDDRTIRLWDLSSINDHQIDSSVTKRPIKDTGFGEVAPDSQDILSSKRSIATAMGHASRIWQVKFIIPRIPEPGKATPMNVLSFGEDSTVQQWALDGWSNWASHDGPNDGIGAEKATSKSKATLTHLQEFSHHTGKHIWSSSLVPTEQLQSRLATGGADGAISVFDIFLDSHLEDGESVQPDGAAHQAESPGSHERSQSWIKSLDDLVEPQHFTTPVEKPEPEQPPKAPESDQESPKDAATQKKKSKKKAPPAPKDAFGKYALVKRNQLLFTTAFGRVIVQSNSPTEPWIELSLPNGSESDLKSYSVVTGIPDHGIAILAGANGKVYMHCPSQSIEQIADLKHKVAGLFYISRASHDSILVLATLLGSTEASLITLRPFSSKEVTVQTINLPPGFVVTSAGEVNDLIILGSRNGQIAAYDLNHEANPQIIALDRRFKCRDAITSVIKFPTALEAPDHFVITARDGTYSIFKTSVGSDSDNTPVAMLQLVHQASLPFGPMIEGASFCGRSLIVHGFRSKTFIVWNETEQSEVSRVDCGGAHRSYAYSLLSQNFGTYFAYTKASKLHIHEQYRPSLNVLKTGGHGREIKSCAVSADQRFIATAAEDTNIRIWGYHDHHDGSFHDKLQCYTTLRKHSAGVQHLQWAPASETLHYLFSGGGNEEFNVWAISSVPGFGLGAVCEATLEDMSEERDLRIMSFDVVAVGGDESGEATYLIAMAFSDSTIRAYWYSKSQGFEKFARGRYTSSCLTQINVLPSSSGDTTILTASTDGHLALWKFGEDSDEADGGDDVVEIAMMKNIKVHQSAILSLEFLPIGPDDFLIATGGDDNAISVAYLSSAEFSLRLTVPSAHAAAVNGLCFVAHAHDSAERMGSFRICTVGGDQKVKSWEFAATAEIEQGAFKLRELKWHEGEVSDETTTTVPDAAGIATFGGHCGHSHCLVYGNGIEVFEA